MVRVWEQARAKGVGKIAKLEIRVFDAEEGLRLTGLVESVQGATKHVALEGGYETKAGGTLDIDYSGPLDDAGSVREFLQSQFRAAVKKNLEAICELTFEDGFPTTGEEPKHLTERLARFVSGAVVVSATTMEE